MVSPFQSIVSGIRHAPLQAPSARSFQGLGQRMREQEVAASTAQKERALGTARYLNQLGKQLLSTDESKWETILAPNLQALQTLGYTPEVLRGATREQVEGLVAQTEAITSDPKLGLERDKLRQRELEREQRQRQFESKQGELKPGVQKILNDSQDAAIESGARARQLGFLTDDLRRAGDIGAGSKVAFNEFLKERLGTQDDVTELRRRYEAIRSSEAVQNLPPGVASDKDIELALRGFPASTANKEQLISFLEGARKMAEFQEKYNRIKSELISEQGSTRGLLKRVEERLKEDTAVSDEDLFKKYGIE